MACDVFISFNRSDQVLSDLLYDSLRESFAEKGLTVWKWDRSTPEEPYWFEEQDKRIAESKLIIFLVSKDSVSSEMCMMELRAAGVKLKRMLFIVIDDTYLHKISPWSHYAYSSKIHMMSHQHDWAKTVMETVDKCLEENVREREPAEHATSHIFSSSRFIRNYDGKNCPRYLHLSEEFFGREAELEMIGKLCSSKSFIILKGIPISGKTSVIRKFVNSSRTFRMLDETIGGPLSLLVLDCGARMGDDSIYRELAAAFPTDPDVEEDEDWFNLLSSNRNERIEALFAQLSRRIGNSNAVVILENMHKISGNDLMAKQLYSVIESRTLENALILCETRGQLDGIPVSLRRQVKPPVEVGPMKPEDAANLIYKYCPELFDDGNLVDKLQEWSVYLLPGILCTAANRFNCSPPRAGRIRGTRDFLSFFEDVMQTYESEGALGLFSACSDLVAPDNRTSYMLMSMAVSCTISIPAASLSSLGVTEESLRELKRHGFINHVREDYYLGDFLAAVLRNRLARWFSGREYEYDSAAFELALQEYLSAIIMVAERRDELDILKGDLESFIASIKPEETQECCKSIRAQIMKVIVDLSAEDLFHPLSPTESGHLVNDIARSSINAFGAALSRLTLYLRFENDAMGFLYALEQAVAQATEAPISTYELYLLDRMSFSGGRRHHLYGQCLKLREQMYSRIEAMCNGEGTEGQDKRICLKRAINWYLNNSRLAIQCGIPKSAGEALAHADKHAASMLEITDFTGSDVSWLQSTILVQRAELSLDSATRAKYAQQAMQLLSDHWHVRSRNLTSHIVMYLRCARIYAGTLEEDCSRLYLIKDVQDEFIELLGVFKNWDLSHLAVFVAFVRDISSMILDTLEQLRIAQFCVELLRQRNSDVALAMKAGEIRPALVQARCWRLLSLCHYEADDLDKTRQCYEQAEAIATRIVEQQPSAQSWFFLLRLKLRVPSFALIGEDYEETSESIGSLRISGVQETVRKCEAWLREHMGGSRADGRLALACQNAQPDIRNTLIQKSYPGSVNGFIGLKPSKKASLARAEYIRRRRAIDAIENKTGSSIELFKSRAWLELDYQMLIETHLGGKHDYTKLWSYLDEATLLWPYDLDLADFRAWCYQYTWQYENAINIYRGLIPRLLSGRSRRRTVLRFASCLLKAGVYYDSIRPNNETGYEASALIQEAKRVLDDQSLRAGKVPKKAIILADRVQLELSKEVNWKNIEGTFRLVVGGIEEYARTLSQNLEIIRTGGSDKDDHIYTLIRQNCTDSGGLQELGMLYLRRGELVTDAQSVEYCRKAFACFDACRVLHESFSGKEHVVVAYLKARTISRAIEISRSMTPFEVASQPDLKRLALSLFQSSRDRSVGAFRAEILQRSTRFQELLKELKETQGRS